ncbi:MAG: type II secretion system F family protein [Candidatus Diapherotrites archaeon]|nr:type II secretion system F family protein [Candidatus Diapherotrites archaeon]
MKSPLEKILKKNAAMRERELEAHKSRSMRLSIFISLFIWLIIGVVEKNILKSGAIALIAAILLFATFLSLPVLKKRAHAKKVEAELPLFLLQLSTEIKIGKSFLEALKDCTAQNLNEKRTRKNLCVADEFGKVVADTEKGATFQEALNNMNNRMESLTIRRACSSLSNLHLQGKKDVDGLKKLAQELLLKQKIESREFSSKMVVYALVFVAVSAIVPAMFQSFILIGSYFMKISFTPEQVFAIIVVFFPAVDIAILSIINSKTPAFLRQ